jgi:hypothetical protein
MIGKAQANELARAVRDAGKVSDSPHDIYRYPARFSPIFVRKAIELFSRPGDTILDPFCGGGTSIVEAVRLGRRAVGVDVSALAAFLSRTKTTPLSATDREAILGWSEKLRLCRSTCSPNSFTDGAYDPYYLRNLPPEAQLFFGQIVQKLPLLNRRQSDYVRLILLATGQWALDCKLSLPSQPEMLSFFRTKLSTSLDRFLAFFTEAATMTGMSNRSLLLSRRIICASSETCDADLCIPKNWRPVRLVLTSPPYPGVHVLYHRWQVFGRRETPAPFWLANQRDGAGEAHYSLGRRDESQLTRYFRRLQAVFSSVRGLVSPDARVIQLVAFSEPSWQLPTYLRAMSAAGFSEIHLSGIQRRAGARVWRNVPGRKWYAALQSSNSAGREVLLVHRPTRRGVFD